MQFNIRNELIKINTIVGNKFNSKLISLVILLIIGAFLEMVGIGLIPLIISSILDFEAVIEFLNKIIVNFKLLENIQIDKININTFLLFILFFFIVKNLFILLVFYYESKLEFQIKKNISNELFNKYLRSPYEEFHLKRSSSQLIRNLAVEVSNFSAFLNAIINFVREITVFTFLISLILIVNFKLTLSILIFFLIILGVYYLLFNKKIKISGKQYVVLKEKIIDKISQVIFSIKEVFVYGKENLIYSKFSEDINNYENKIFFINFTKKIPRVLLEISAVCLIVFFLIFFIETKNMLEIISLSSLIAMSAIRMVPSLNTITNSFVNIKFYNASFNVIYDEFKNIKVNSEKKLIKKESLIEKEFDQIFFKKISYSYNINKNFIFKNFDFLINKGELVKIFGSSGKGKSTFLNILAGLLKVQSGELQFLNKGKILNKNEIKNLFAYVPQDTFILDESIKNNIVFGNKENFKKLEKCIEESSLDEWIKRSPNGLDTNCGQNGINLSGGQKQRIAIARALYADKPVLLFDEITSNLDNENENKIIMTINKLKKRKTIIFITHRDNKTLLHDKILNLDLN